MRMLRGTAGAVLVLVGMALGTAWTTDAVPGQVEASARYDVGRGLAGTISHPDSVLVVAEATFSPARTVDPRLGAAWVPPGTVAAIGAACLVRRLHGGARSSGHQRPRRDGVSRRGPPARALA
jgi:hypothetical protein